MKDRSTKTWRKSTYSAGQEACVEVAFLRPRSVAVRDSKDPEGPCLFLDVADLRALTHGEMFAERRH